MNNDTENPTALIDEPSASSEEIHSTTPEMEELVDQPEPGVTFKRSQLYTILLLMYALFVPLMLAAGIGVGYLVWGPGNEEVVNRDTQDTAAEAAAQAAASTPEIPAQVTRYDVPIDDDPVYGSADAPITIIEFSDYECPYCRKWHQEVFPRLMEEYPDQVRLVYRDFPLTSIHSNAVPAAIAANCAAEQDAYWEFNERLFSMDLGLGPEAYQGYADELGLDTDSFTECIDSNRYEEEVQADFDYASQLGIRSTPTFFINGIALVGAQPYDVFKQVIDQELAGELD
jgi:protein-disulfide isomerase